MSEITAAAQTELRGLLQASARAFDSLERVWQRFARGPVMGATLTAAFLFSLSLVEINRQGWVVPPWVQRMGTNHFTAVGVAFTALLLFEVLSLVFALAKSVARSVGKQFEILTLIMLREAFIEFGYLTEPIDWEAALHPISAMMADMVGALLLFVMIELYYRVQRHRKITNNEREQATFIAAKKAVALGILVSFVLLALRAITTHAPMNLREGLFAEFFTALVFCDILLVLISLAFSSDYHVVFRNSGFAAAAVIARLSLAAPEYINVVLALVAGLFTLGLAYAYAALVHPEPD